MTYIAPNSYIIFYEEFGLSPSYENSLHFTTWQEKEAFYNDTQNNGLTVIAEARALSYTRLERGRVRVQLPISTLINAGYMRFKNTNFEDKMFYAFITGVRYINNETTEVLFELDYIQTWMGIFGLKHCFVERMHSPTDAIGDNIVDEGLPCGDILYGKAQASGHLGSGDGWSFCFASTFPFYPNK